MIAADYTSNTRRNLSLHIIFLLICILSCSESILANFQSIRFRHLTENIALKQSNVNHIFQDSLGMMYFGTNEGLFLYDGVKSTLHWNHQSEELAPQANNIVSICNLPSSKVLISTLGGLFVFNSSMGEFNPVNLNDSINSWTSLVQFEEKIFLISSNDFGTLELTNGDTGYQGRYTSLRDQLEEAGVSKQALIREHALNHSGQILMAVSNHQVVRYSIASNKMENLGVRLRNIESLYEDKEGFIWAGALNNVLYRYHPKTNEVSTFRLRRNLVAYRGSLTIRTINEDEKGNLIIGSNKSGIAIIKAADKYKQKPEPEYYISDPYNSNSLCDNNVTYLFCDRSNAVFVGTEGNGINQMSLGQGCFVQHIIDEDNANSLDHIRVNAIYDDNKGNIWIGTRLGLNRYNQETRQYFHYHQLIEGGNSLPIPGADQIGEVTSFCRDKDGFLWMGTYGTGLLKYNYETNQFIQYRDSLNELVPTERITDVFQDNKGKIWIATHGKGLARIEKEDSLKHQLQLDYFRDPAFATIEGESQFVDVIFEDRNRMLWFSFRRSGLFRYNPLNGEIKHFHHISGDTTSLSNNAVISICDDSKGNLWLGTARGLNKFDIKNEVFTAYTMESGLPHHSICGVLSDNDDRIWLYTQRGIYRFDPEIGYFAPFIENSRIFHEDYTIDATHKNAQGKLYLGTLNNGCIGFHPDSIKESTYIPEIKLSSLKISNKPVREGQELDGRVLLSRSLNKQEIIELNHTQNDVSFEFTALAYNEDVEDYFVYQMEGVDKAWIETDERHKQVAYSNLSPGKYTFKVKAMNRVMPDQAKEKQLVILIHPPYWATTQAYFLYVLILLALIVLLYRYTMARIRLKNDLRIERMKLGFFTNVSHEFRTPLTLLSGPLQKLMKAGSDLPDSERMNYYQLMNRNTEKMLQLVDQILDVRKIDNAKMTLKKERTDFMAFVKDVCERFRVEATEKQMQYTIDISTEALLMDVDRDKMEKVLYNVLSNAFKYTPDNGSIAVEVNVQTQEKMVVIEVKDTGIGIPESQLKSVFNRFYRADQNGGGNINGTGLGLSIVKNFVEMHGGKVSVKNNREAGCIFSFTLPIDPSIQTQAELPVSAKEESSHVVAPQINQLPAEPENLENAPLVLIVDDNAEMRLFLENQLRGTYRVITADNGQKGLDEAIQHFPDLIISDVMMPLMDGLEFCTKVKSDVRICHIPVILLTARSSTDHQIEGIKTGADAYLTKPFNIDYLDARVQNLIESRVRLRAAFTQVTDEPKDIEKSVSNDLDKEFLQKATVVVETNMEDPSFTVPRFIQEMGMSNSVLYRKLKALTDLSANEFIRHIRLKKASEILQTGQFNVAEVAVKVGFNDPKYFSTCFKKQYGKSPMQYIQDM